jgi:flagellar assembly protein FliH
MAMAQGTANTRRPAFLALVGSGAPAVVRLAFGDGSGGGHLRVVSEPAPRPDLASLGQERPLVGAEAAPPAPPAPPPGPGPADVARLEGAIERLRLQSDRLAAEMRADALELALLIARKIVEGELTVNVDRVIAMARSAVRRLGESRRIVVRLAPADAEAIQERSAGRAGDSLAVGSSQVEIVPDHTLSRGDCVVEGDLVAVDARLDTRMAELRRVLTESVREEQT